MLDIAVIVVWSLCFPLAVLYTYFKYKRRKTAGKEVLSVAAPSGDRCTLSHQFPAAHGKKWYRIQSAFVLRGSASGPAATLHPYTLTLLDEDMRVVFREERCLSEFFAFCWHVGSAPGATGMPACRCDPILLDFIPPAPGVYTLEVTLKAREQHSRIEDLTLSVREGVWVFKQKPYVHTWLDLRRHRGPEQDPTGRNQPKETPP